MTRRARVEIVPAKPGVNHASGKYGHFLRLRASNGRILAHSEVYASRSNAKRAARRLLATASSLAPMDVCEVTQ